MAEVGLADILADCSRDVFPVEMPITAGDITRLMECATMERETAGWTHLLKFLRNGRA
jgi:hypothetical protein